MEVSYKTVDVQQLMILHSNIRCFSNCGHQTTSGALAPTWWSTKAFVKLSFKPDQTWTNSVIHFIVNTDKRQSYTYILYVEIVSLCVAT